MDSTDIKVGGNAVTTTELAIGNHDAWKRTICIRVGRIIACGTMTSGAEGGIDGPNQSLGVGGLGPLDDVPGDGQVGVRVELGLSSDNGIARGML